MKKFLKVKKQLAFTLAETMIVIVVLGIIATLTIPALVNKNKESVAKTKVRKAMAAYESALNKMIIENDLKSDDTLTAWAGDADSGCANSTNYFKKVQGDGCIFKTSDGIWWNISDIERPVISFKEINAGNEEQITANANNANDKTAFVLVGRFGNDGSLRVDDLAYETANDTNNSKAQVEKLYALLGMKKSSSGDGSGSNVSPFAACNHADTCEVGGITYTKVSLTDYEEDYCMEWDGYEDTNNCGINEFGYEECKWVEECKEWKTLSVKGGEYYMAIEGYPDDYETQAFNYEGSTCDLCQNEWNIGDYYNAARRHCSGNLANISQLKALANQGLLPIGNFWASEEIGPYDAYNVDDNGNVRPSDGKASDRSQVLCLGQ